MRTGHVIRAFTHMDAPPCITTDTGASTEAARTTGPTAELGITAHTTRRPACTRVVAMPPGRMERPGTGRPTTRGPTPTAHTPRAPAATARGAPAPFHAAVSRHPQSMSPDLAV